MDDKDRAKIDLITIGIVIVISVIILVAIGSWAQESNLPTPQTFDVTFQWSLNTEPDVSHYNLHYGPSSRNYTETSANIPHPTNIWKVTGLIYGHMYYFALTATDSENLTSDYSNEVNTNGYDGLPPMAPDGLIKVGELTVHYSDGSTLKYIHSIEP